ncbi:MAG: hypothetical protein LBQ80_03255 [Clostridium sp.]|jgi:hypothetical protein|nr:hypothetical protein [Clostridium sp.]
MVDKYDELKTLACDKLVATLCKPNVVIKGWQASAETLTQVKIRDIDVQIERSTSKDTVIQLTLCDANAELLLDIYLQLLSLYQLVEGFFPRVEKVEFFNGNTSIQTLDENEYKTIFSISQHIRNT